MTRPYAEAKVLPPPGEMDRLQMNQADMERVANETHGKFFTLANVDELIESIPPGRRVALNQPCPPWLIWNHWSVFALVLSMFAAEWVFRKRLRLV